MKRLQQEGSQLFSDTSSLMKDTVSLVSDVEELEQTLQGHWMEILMDVVCCVLCCFRKQEEVCEEEEEHPLIVEPRYKDFRKELKKEYV